MGTEPVVVILPTYNERDTLQPLVRRISEELPQAAVVVVDDNSPDGTGELASALATRDPRVHVVHRPRKEGLGAAYVEAFTYVLQEWPHADFIIQMDADFSHDPAYLRPMLAMAQTTDLVIGSRYVNGVSIVHWPMHRLILSQVGSFYAKTVTGLPCSDCTSGFKCYRADVLRALPLRRIRSNGYVFQIETLYRAWRMGFRLTDFPIIFYERTQGKSKLHIGIAIEAVFVVARLGAHRLLTAPPPGKSRTVN